MPALAAEPPSSKPGGAVRAAGALHVAQRRAQPCQHRSVDRGERPQGTLLWGTKRGWGGRAADERSSVLVSVDLDPMVESGVKALRLEGGRLEAASPVGTVLRGTASDGKPVEVAICHAEPDPRDPEMVWYHVEAWNPVAQDWENPCVATGRVPNPRALAVGGIWDASGAHQDAPGKVTFACENGAISKCVTWGYKPWASVNGHSLADLHQACTRMARADYCGNGQSHTHEQNWIDMYDSLGVQARTTEATADFQPALASFEAAWLPDGAACLARTREGRALETILAECPGRFRTDAPVELKGGDRCVATRAGVDPATAPLRNQLYGGQGLDGGKSGGELGSRRAK